MILRGELACESSSSLVVVQLADVVGGQGEHGEIRRE